MMKQISLKAFLMAGIIALAAAGCSKDKYTTKPQLKFKEVNGYEFRLGETMRIELELTDKEGDVLDSLCIIRNVKNFAPLPADTLYYTLPQDAVTTSNFKANVTLCFTINRINGECPTYNTRSNPQPRDTTSFKFFIKDKAKNVSDTAFVDKPIVLWKS